MAKIGHVPNFVWFLSVAEMAAQLLLQWVPEPDIWASPHSSHFGLVCIFWPYCTPSQVWVPYSPPGFCCLTNNRQSLHHIIHQLIKCVLACQSNYTFFMWGRYSFLDLTWLISFNLWQASSLSCEPLGLKKFYCSTTPHTKYGKSFLKNYSFIMLSSYLQVYRLPASLHSVVQCVGEPD